MHVEAGTDVSRDPGSIPGASIRLAWARAHARSWQAILPNRRGDNGCESSESNVLSEATEGSAVEGHCASDAKGQEAGMSDQLSFVYILRCAGGTYYVGSTTDVPARVKAHNAGSGPRFTACRRPGTLVYSALRQVCRRTAWGLCPQTPSI